MNRLRVRGAQLVTLAAVLLSVSGCTSYIGGDLSTSHLVGDTAWPARGLEVEEITLRHRDFDVDRYVSGASPGPRESQSAKCGSAPKQRVEVIHFVPPVVSEVALMSALMTGLILPIWTDTRIESFALIREGDELKHVERYRGKVRTWYGVWGSFAGRRSDRIVDCKEGILTSCVESEIRTRFRRRLRAEVEDDSELRDFFEAADQKRCR